MKKFIIAALAVITIAGSAIAAGPESDVSKLNTHVKTSFQKHFADAKNVNWSVRESFVKASFTLLDQPVEAFFGEDGELIGTSRKVNFEQLPVLSLSKIKKCYGDYAVTEAIEFTQDSETSYYVSLSKGEKKQILQVTAYGGVSVYHPVVK